MRGSIFVLLFCLIIAFMPANKKKRIIFFGDSITQTAVKPGGYIAKMDSIIAALDKKDQYELVGAGISSNKVYDLYLRLEEDILKKEPDIVVIFIGVNDVWHKRLLGTGTDADKFEKFYSSILKRLAEKNIKAILCTPAVIGEKNDFTNELDGDLNKYCNIIRGIAAKNNLPLVDLRKAFLEYNGMHNTANKESGILTTDRVHLNARGSQLVADEMWKVIAAL
ncbi:MAG TPA: GDSL-type esterase/lipase family protein [Ferruginibacter sp.]|nr:GDSL-type esterase/lipase family protein [Ferruginibacter sp.]